MTLQRTSNSFHWLDYVVLSVSLAASCTVGIYFAVSGGKQKTTAEFLMGNRSLKLIPVSLSMVASFLSAILILGGTAEIYLNGIAFHFSLIGAIIAYLMSAFLFVGLIYPLRITSAYEYLERRFQSRLVRCMGTVFSLLVTTVYAGLATFAPCTATEKVTGNALRREHVIIACSMIGTFYTMIGGLKAVVWVDTIQAGIMFFGTLAVAIMALIDSGGWESMWQLNKSYGRLQLPSASFDLRERHTIWGLAIGQIFYWLNTLGASQTAVQRFNSLPTLKTARLCLIIAMPGHCLMVSVCTLLGLAIFGRYAYVACDIFSAKWADSNQIVTYYVMDRMNFPGFPGLFSAALLAAALSSVSSALNSASTIAWTDLLQPLACKGVSETRATLIAKCLVAVFGTLSTLVAYAASQLGGTVIQATITLLGASVGPSMGQFLMACLFPRANWVGAIVGPLAGLACGLWLGVGSYLTRRQHVQLPGNVTGCDLQDFNVTSALLSSTMSSNTTTVASVAVSSQGFLAEYVYSISYLWTAGIGTIFTVIIGLLSSWIVERGRYVGFVDPIDVDERHLLPGARQLWRAVGGCGGGVRIIRVTQEEDDKQYDSRSDGVSTDMPSLDTPSFTRSNIRLQTIG